ncbi:MAG TPA: Gfo/Idh/MocA family oxidoreductase, partial [Verrucomicrobiae bacterium]|nr:Gfo/Idh/MocA family oxidoreductase [Verrucomicrobiae bacterium]
MQIESPSITRRRFLAGSTKTVSAMALAPALLARAEAAGDRRRLSPNDKLNIAFIGVTGRGSDNINDITGAEEVNVVALCDVNETNLNGVGLKFPAAKRYRDYRKLLESEKSLDAVVISIPDHNHAPASMMALKLGKHVYCEKPLTRTVKEARALTLASREAKVATQMGNQGMAFEGNRFINEWLADGCIGPVREVHVWSDRPTHRGRLPGWWPQGIERPTDTPPVPAALDWDLWLGPAPLRPYHPAYVPFKWRGWW